MKAKLLKIWLLLFLSILSFSSFSADRFWVGGTGNWNDVSHWSIESGGIGGATIPTSSDNVFIDSKSFTAIGQSITISGSSSCNNLTWTATSLSPELIGKGSSIIQLSGSLSVTDTYIDSFLGTISFIGSMDNTIQLSKKIAANLLFNGSGSWTFLSEVSTSQNIKLQTGTVKTNNFPIFANTFDGNGIQTRALFLGNSVVTVNSWLFGTTANLTFDGSNAKIIVLGDWAKDLQRGNLIYGILTNSDKRAADFTTTVSPFTCDSISGKAKGKIMVTVTGLTAPIQYMLYKNNIALYATKKTPVPSTALTFTVADSLMSDTSYHNIYKLEIYKTNVFQVSKVVNYPATWPAPMIVPISVLKHVTCANKSIDAELIANPTGGSGLYRYSWGLNDKGIVQTTQIGKDFGNHIGISCGVTDSNHCYVAGSIVYQPWITGYTGPYPFVYNPDPVSSTPSCGSQNNGTISVKMLGGWGSRQFTLASLSGTDNRSYQSDSNFQSLKTNETYTITAKDTNGCINTSPNPITIGVIQEPTVNAGVDTTICADLTVNLNAAVATNCSIIAWTTTGDGTFSSSSIRNPIYTPGTSDKLLGTVKLTITGTGLAGCNNVTDFRIVSISPLPKVFAGSDQNVCLTGLTYSLSGATASNQSSVTWTRKGDGIFSDPSIVQPTYTFKTADTTSKFATVVLSVQGSGGCATRNVKDSLDFTMSVPPFNYAGADQNMCKGVNYTASLASIHYYSSIVWSTSGDGSFSSTSIEQPIYTPGTNDKSNGSVTLTAKAIANSPCVDKTSTVKLTFFDPPTITAGNDHIVCSNGLYTITNEAAQTYCNTLQWSTSGDGTFNDKTKINPIYIPGANDNTLGSVTLTLTGIGNGGCSTITVTDNMTLTMVDSAIAYAGLSQNVCKNSTLDITTATAQNYSSILWTTSGSSGTLTSTTTLATKYIPSIADKAAGSVILTLIANGNAPCPNVPSAITITLSDQPIIELGLDQKVCSNGPYDLKATTGSAYSALQWTTTGDGTFNTPTTLNPIYTPGSTDNTNNSVMLKLQATGTGGCSAMKVRDSLTVQLIDSAFASASAANHSICKGSTLTISDATAQNYSSLSWTSTGTGTFSNPLGANVDYVPSAGDIALPAPASVKLTLTAIGNAPCPDFPSQITLKLDEQPTVFAGNDFVICSKAPYTLAASTEGYNNTRTWTTPTGDGSFNNASTLHPIYAPGNNDKTVGSVLMVLTVTGKLSCTAMSKSDSILLTMNDPPIVNAGAIMDICNNKSIDITDASASNYASLLWSSSTSGTFTAGTNLLTSYNSTPADLIANQATLTLKAIAKPSCVDATSQKTVNLFKPALVTLPGTDIVCFNSTYTFVGDTATNYKTIIWEKTFADGTFSSINTLHPTYTLGANDILSGLAFLTLKATGNADCSDDNRTMTLTIDKGPQIDAGTDVEICYNGTAKISGATAQLGTYASLVWTTTGNGTFDDATSLNPVYTPGTADLTAHTVKLKLTALGKSKCVNAIDSMNVSILPQLTVSMNSGGAHPFSTKCFGGWDAEAHVVATGGNLPYTYKWNDVKITGKDTLLFHGTFIASVTDSKGCIVSNSIVITEPLKMTTSFTPGAQIKCHGDSTASVTVNTLNGFGGYSYNWSNGDNIATATILKAGKKYVTVTDGNTCFVIDSTIITEPTKVTSSFITKLPNCPGDGDGSIIANASGGTMVVDYNYVWSNANTTNTISGLSTGTFSITITDDNNCKYDTTFVLPDPQSLSVLFDITQVKCYGDSTGQIIAHVSGGTQPYTYLWYPSGGNDTLAIIKNLPASSTPLNLDIFDKNGCEFFSPDTLITQPPVFSVGVGKPSSFLIQNTTKIAVCFKGTEDMVQDIGFDLIAPNGTILTLSKSPSKGSNGTTPNCNVGRNFDVCFTTEAPAKLDMCNIHPYSSGWDPSWTINNRIGWPENPAIAGDFKPESPWSAIYGQDPSNGGWVLQIQDWFKLKSGEVVDSSIWQNASISFTDTNTTTHKLETITFQKTGLNLYINNPSNLTTGAFTKYKTPLKLSTSCYGVCDAQGIMNPIGGISPYSYNWSDPTIPNKDTLMLCGGFYTVTANDKNGCTSIGSVNIIQPAKIVMKLDSIANLCYGKATGQAIATYISGGTLPLDLVWNSGPTIPVTVAKNLKAGKYFLTTTDENNCHQIDSIVVRDSLKVLTKITIDSTLCSASSDGAIHLVPMSSGTYLNPPFTYVWQTPPGGTTADLIGLSSGTYNVTVNDDAGCQLDTVATVFSPLPITYGGTTISLPTCQGRADGFIVLNIVGGTKSYSYKWSNAAWTADSTRDRIVGLKAGTYNVTVTDKYACPKDTTFTITDPLGMVPTITATDSVKCNGNTNGTASVLVANGISPYTYLWSTGSTLGNVSGLAAGTYFVTVYDKFLCNVTASATVNEPNVLALSTSITDSVTCKGMSDAQFKVSTLGGTKPYSFEWDNGSADSLVFGADSGFYTVLVTDVNFCTATATLFISEPSQLVISSKGQTPSECSTLTGNAFITASGGTTGYSYLWSNGVTLSSNTAILAGDYDVTVADRFNCQASTSIKVKDTTSLRTKVFPIQQSVSCKGRTDGSGYVVASGKNTAPYKYKWSDGSTDDTLKNVGKGKYFVTVTDAFTCTRIDSLVIDESNILAVVVDSVHTISCHLINDGLVRVKASGGAASAGYSYIWSNSAITSQISVLTAGNYTVTVSDTSSCSVVVSQIIVKDVFNAIFVNTKDVLCHNVCDGSSILSANKVTGKSPYSYLWGNGETDSLAKALCAGTTNVTVTDKNGCTYSDSIVINDLVTSMAVTFDTAFTPCGLSQGKAIAKVTGGVTTYSYKWSNGVTTSSNLNVPVGIYDVTVTDANGCKLNSSIEVADTSHMSFAIKTVDVWCIPCSGKAIVYKTDPTDKLAYTYKWQTGSTKDTLKNACLGWQTVKVTREADLCVNTFRDTVKKAGGLDITMHIWKTRNCVYAKDASAYVTYKNNVGPVFFKWSTGSTDSSVVGLGSGTFKVTVTDGTCTLVDSITFVDPISPTVAMSSKTVSCFQGADGTATLKMLNALVPDSIIWNDRKVNPQKTAKAINLALGMYTATVYYSNSCVFKDSILVDQNSKLTVIWNVTNTVCNSDIGKIIAKGNGGVPFKDSVINYKYDYQWHALGMDSIKLPQYNNDSITGLGVDYYVLKVTDSLKCSFTSTPILLSDNGDITATVDSIRFPTCPTISNGYYRIKPASINPPFSYSFWKYNTTITDSAGAWWKPTGQTVTTGIADSLTPGSYKVYIANDASKNCKQVVLFTIGTNYLTAATTKKDVICPLEPNGIGAVSASRGLPYLKNPNYRFIWSTGSTNDSITGIAAGIYTVTVTDSISCAVVRNITIIDTMKMRVVLPYDTTQTICYGTTAKTITPHLVGGQSPYSYKWDGTASVADLVAPTTGWHKVIVNDTGCYVASDSIFIEQKGHLTMTYDTLRTLCGQSKGQITINADATSMPVTYLWSTGETTSIIKNLKVDFYTVTVTDAQNCSITNQIKIEDSSTVAFNIYKDLDVLCPGKPIGAAHIGDTTGGTSPYTSIIWENRDFPFNKITTWKADSLREGFIQVKVFDSKGCMGIDSINILSKKVFKVAFSNIINDASCSAFPVGTGSVQATASNGKPAYSYYWNTNPAVSNPMLTNVTSGTYTVTAVDMNGCTEIDSVDISKSILVVDSVDQTNIKCYGFTDGSIEVKASKGLGNALTYTWSNTSQTTPKITGLAVGKYIVTVQEASNNCVAIDTFVITQPQKVSFAFTTLKKTSCKDSTGIVKTTVTGGVIPYSYVWKEMVKPDTLSKTDTFVNYWADYFKVYVTDAKGCTYIDTTRTTDTSLMVIQQLTITPVSCYGLSDGYLSVKALDGAGKYKYTWPHDASIKDSIANTLKAGFYTVRATDDSTCWRDYTTEIKQPDTLKMSFPYPTKITCFGGTDTVAVAAMGGNGGNGFSWIKDLTTLTVTDTIIPAATIGTYQVTITDAKNCKAVSSVVITQANQMTLDSIVVNAGCGALAASGTAKITAITTDYAPATFKWWDGLTDSLHTDLSKGTYDVIIKDAQKCIDTLKVTVKSEMFDSLKIDKVQLPKCNYNSPTGTLAGRAYGSILPYQWQWSRSVADNLDTVKKVLPGKYSVTVTSKNGCKISDSATVTPLVEIEALITTKTDNGEVNTVHFCKNDSTTLVGVAKHSIYYPSGKEPLSNERFLWGVKDGSTDELLATMSNNVGSEISVKPFQPTTYQMWYTIYGCSVPVREVTLSYYDTIGLHVEIVKDGEFLHDTTSIIKGYKLQLQPENEPWFVTKDPSKTGFIEYVWNSYDSTMKADGIVLRKILNEKDYAGNKAMAIDIAPIASTWYIVVGKTNYGCYERDSVRIKVEPSFSIPSGISPNGDGINDKWNLPYLKQFPDARVTIFNRWGIIIWEKEKDYTTGAFEGKNKDGKELPLGTYYYLIEFNDGKGTKPLAGSLTIVR